MSLKTLFQLLRPLLRLLLRSVAFGSCDLANRYFCMFSNFVASTAKPKRWTPNFGFDVAGNNAGKFLFEVEYETATCRLDRFRI